jgi:hypothetical protein
MNVGTATAGHGHGSSLAYSLMLGLGSSIGLVTIIKAFIPLNSVGVQ